MNSHLKVIPRQEIGRATWDAFVDSSDEAWLWHRYDLQDALSAWPGRNDLSLGIEDLSQGGEIIAIIPLHIVNRRVGHVWDINVLDSLGGPACRNGLGEKSRNKLLNFIREQLVALMRKQRSVEVRVALSPMAPAFRGEECPLVNPLLHIGCKNTLTQTWVVELRQGKDNIWQRMEGRARTAVRKAEKNGVNVRKADRPDDLEVYYRLHCETYRRTGVSPHPKAYFDAIWRNFLATGLAQVWFAEHNGEVVAAENFGVYKNAAIYWTGAASSHGLPLEANSLLQWTAMQWMVDAGLEWYETGEAFPNALKGKSKGLNDFKKSFGGKLYPYYRGCLDIGCKTHKIVNLAKELITLLREK